MADHLVSHQDVQLNKRGVGVSLGYRVTITEVQFGTAEVPTYLRT